MGFGLLFSACSCSFWLDTLRNSCGSSGERHLWVLSRRPHHVLVPAPSRRVIRFVLVSGTERRPDGSVLSLSLGKAPAVFSGCGFPPELGVSPPVCWAPARCMSPEPHQGRKGSSHRGCLGRRSETRARLLPFGAPSAPCAPWLGAFLGWALHPQPSAAPASSSSSALLSTEGAKVASCRDCRAKGRSRARRRAHSPRRGSAAEVCQ